jgi:alpha-glucuronidase
MVGAREVLVDYMAPLGLHHQTVEGHHYGPGPWLDGAPRRTAVHYHRADARGIGFDRTPTGSNAIEQYFDPLRRQWSKPKRCPEELLLWFHHVAWSEPLRSGRSLWDELCHRYQRGVDAVPTFSQRPLPPGGEPAEKTLEEYRAIRHYYVPGHHDPFVAKQPEQSEPSSNQ